VGRPAPANLRGSISNRALFDLSVTECSLDHWETPSRRVVLTPDEAHVWMVRTDPPSTDVARLMHTLESGERERADRFTHASGRSGFVVARSALRGLLASYLGVPPADIELTRTASGKPVLGGAHPTALRFSVAHSGRIGLLSFASVDVGVDVERLRPVARADRIASRVFSEAMRRRLDALPAEQWQSAFFDAWTQREALVKAVGGVLMATHDPLDFEWPSPAGARLTRPSAGEPEWTVAKLPSPEGYAAALVATGPVRRLRLFVHPEHDPSTGK
jgi:4'-phosphopantetheinyl transferase